tara:strand:- start:17 stop:466 length:450 start_codon:yes stop_codon:yes gene_type:complete
MIKDEITHLNLTGKNEEDLNIISAYLQDSIVLTKDITFLRKNKSFIIMANRFMWEDVEKGLFREPKRIRTAIKFENVINVKSKNIDQKNTNETLEFLAMKCDTSNDKNKKIKIFFAGNSAIFLILEAIEIIMDDLGEPWNVKSIPKHEF